MPVLDERKKCGHPHSFSGTKSCIWHFTLNENSTVAVTVVGSSQLPPLHLAGTMPCQSTKWHTGMLTFTHTEFWLDRRRFE
ncbi:hypothetical protein J6590_055401 [Homalodisca vitripennis]|nr:hypothetical protein J6590_095849 [Homalodisca vitripennis]KAG8271778.1 hypothetical protein J6590_055401 [Homalodisca vitripennis]